MSFNPRKLLNDSSLVEDSITKLCEYYCNIIKNPDGLCPIPCMSRCYHICNHPFDDGFPPPPPIYSDDDHPGSRSYKLSIFLIISLVILATAFLGFLSYTIYKFYKGWYRSRIRQPPPLNPPQEAEEARVDLLLDEDHGPVVDHPIWYIRTIGLEASIIKAIAICKYKKGDGIVEGTECSVCLNEFQEDESLRLLPKCNHAFHIPCIDTWLRSHTNCPLCRAGIVISTANLGHLEESQLQVSENNTESGQDRELDEVESVQDGSRDRNELKRDEEEDVGLNGFQPLRRSVSVDSLSASMISNAINNEFSVPGRILEKQDLEIGLKSSNSSAGSSTSSTSSNGRSLQKGSSSSSMVMRSLSCSAKVFLSRYNRSSKSSVTLPRTF